MPNFVKRWFDRAAPEAVKPCVPPGQRLYCIGDIHGRLDLLQALHAMILDDAAAFDGGKSLVYLGDYIDRGAQSKEVIDLLINDPLPGFDPTYLLGNHEQTLLDFLRHPQAVAGWLTYGGGATLRSYGVALGLEIAAPDMDQLRDDLEFRLPPGHLEFYQRLELLHVCGSYCFVHAGIRPGVSLQEQRQEDLLWIREDFTDSAVSHQHIVVHGHTITSEVEFRPNRIGIDTGAFHTGVLTCLVLEGNDMKLLQTGGTG